MWTMSMFSMLPLTVASSCLTKTCRMMTTTTSMTTTLRPNFLVLSCSDMSRPISSYPGSFRYCFSRSKQLLDTVSNQAVSKQFCGSLVTCRKCYRVEEDASGKVNLVYVSDTSVPYPYLYIRVPAQVCKEWVIDSVIPRSWSKPVMPYDPKALDNCILVDNVLKFDLRSLQKRFNVSLARTDHQVIYFNIPLDFDVLLLRRFSIPRSVIAKGFVTIWVTYKTLVDVINIFEEKGFFYVDNLVFVDQHTDDYELVFLAI